jgi:hypothetical protein
MWYKGEANCDSHKENKEFLELGEKQTPPPPPNLTPPPSHLSGTF